MTRDERGAHSERRLKLGGRRGRRGRRAVWARAAWAAATLAVSPLAAPAHEGADSHDAPRASDRLYDPPAPGTYRLPPIQQIAEHWLLRPDASKALVIDPSFAATVVAFVYRSCGDPAGCPLSLATLRELDRLLAERPALRARTRLVTVSFDPSRDTPEAMGELAAALAPRGPWDLLTSRGPSAIGPVLADFGQDVVAELAEDGSPAGPLGHVLKVFLVDDGSRVRNIYSVGFLDAVVIRNDIETILLAADTER